MSDRRARHQVHVRHAQAARFAWRWRWKNAARACKEVGITGIFSGGTEFTPQWTRYCVEELFGGPPEESGIYMTPTYGNTLMGLACSKPVTRGRRLQDRLLRPAAAGGHRSRRVSTIPTTVVGYGETGRVKLTTLTKEFFVPGFLERDEGERETPFATLSLGRRQRRAAVSRIGRIRRPSAFTRRCLTQKEVGPFRTNLAFTTKPNTTCAIRTRIRNPNVLNIPVLRWGKPYESLEIDEVVHFTTGEPIATVSQANEGIIRRDMRTGRGGAQMRSESSAAPN